MNETIKKAYDAVENAAIEPIKNAISLRLSNPLFPSVVITWLFLNWERVFVILFSKVDIIVRIERVKSISSDGSLWGVVIPHALTLYYPLFFGVAYVLFSPFFSYLLFYCHNDVKNKLYDARVKGKADNISSEVSLIEAEQKKAHAKDFFDAKYQAEIENQNTRRRQSQSDRVALVEEEENIKKSIVAHNKELNELREVLQSSRDELTSINKSIKEKQDAMVNFEGSRGISFGMESYDPDDKYSSTKNNKFKFHPEDPENPGWIMGWIVYNVSHVKFHSIHSNKEEAIFTCDILGEKFAVAFGSHKPSTDEFMLKILSNK